MKEIEKDFIEFCNKRKCKDCKFEEKQYSNDCLALFSYEKGRADAIEDSFNSLLLMIKNGYDYPNREFEEMFIALVEDAIDSVKDNLKEQK